MPSVSIVRSFALIGVLAAILACWTGCGDAGAPNGGNDDDGNGDQTTATCQPNSTSAIVRITPATTGNLQFTLAPTGDSTVSQCNTAAWTATSATAAADWMVLTPNAGTGPDIIHVSVSQASLPAGNTELASTFTITCGQNTLVIEVRVDRS